MHNYIIRIIILLSTFICDLPEINAQLTGHIYNADNLEPVAGAAVTTSDGKGTITDSTGFFNILLPDTVHEIQITCLGYQSRIVSVHKNTKTLRLLLPVSHIHIDQAIVSAYQFNRKIVALPGAIGLITGEGLSVDRGVNIAPALNRIPGVFMQSGALNTNRISIRGIGSRTPYGTNKIRAYLDDIPLTSGDGTTTLEDIDMAQLGRVEIIKGPTSSIYGAGLGGLIHLYTRKPGSEKIRIQTDNMAGSFGLWKNSVSVETNSPAFSLSVSGNRLASTGFRENSRYQRNSFWLMADYHGNKLILKFLTNYIYLKSHISSSIDSVTYRDDPKAAASNWLSVKGYEQYNRLLSGLSLQYNFSKKFSNQSSIYSVINDGTDLRPFNILSDNSIAWGGRTRFTNEFMLSKVKFQWMYGAEFYHENYTWYTYETLEGGNKGQKLSDSFEKRIYYNLFSLLDMDVGKKLTFSTGFNYNSTYYSYLDRYHTDSNNLSGGYTFRPVFSPRISVNYRIDKELAVYAVVSQGFSPPTLDETLTPAGLINPHIKPETGINYETGSRGRILNDRMYYDFSVYTIRVRNLLVPRRVGEDQYVGVNAGKSSHSGFEGLLKYDLLSPENRNQADIFFSYTYADYRYVLFQDLENDYAGNHLPGVAPDVINAGLEWEWGSGFYSNINFLYTSAMPMNDANSLYSDAYQIVNIKTGYRKELFSNFLLDLYAGIRNIFNEKYASMILVNATGFNNTAPRYYYPGPPVNYFAGLSIRYKKF